ncbi:MAG: outer membrane beta-barrel protein [Candidatus Acidiferrales bacterium]
MKKQGWLVLSVLGLMICLAGAPAHAQDGRISLFGGYSYGTNNFYSYDPGLNGYGVAVAYNLNKHIGLEANFSGHNGTSTIYSELPTTTENGYADVVRQDIYTYTFGPKLSLPVGHFSLFTHFLVGAAHIHNGETESCIPETGGSGSSCSESDYPYHYGSHGNGFAFKTGGGVDWNHGHWGVRILEVDYVHAEVSATETDTCPECTPYTHTYAESANNFELATGVTFNFGGSK